MQMHLEEDHGKCGRIVKEVGGKIGNVADYTLRSV